MGMASSVRNLEFHIRTNSQYMRNEQEKKMTIEGKRRYLIEKDLPTGDGNIEEEVKVRYCPFSPLLYPLFRLGSSLH